MYSSSIFLFNFSALKSNVNAETIVLCLYNKVINAYFELLRKRWMEIPNLYMKNYSLPTWIMVKEIRTRPFLFLYIFLL
jgi:hypothetical protein